MNSTSKTLGTDFGIFAALKHIVNIGSESTSSIVLTGSSEVARETRSSSSLIVIATDVLEALDPKFEYRGLRVIVPVCLNRIEARYARIC